MQIKAVITGHSRGLGAGMVDALLKRRVSILGIARTPAPTKNPTTSITQVALDLANPQAVADWLKRGQMAKFLAPADWALLINNAAMLGPIGQTGHHQATAITDAVQVNVATPMILADAFVAATRTEQTRRILHISSGAARKAYAGLGVYCATKAALDHHARVMATEQIDGLTIASIAPGVVDTGMQTTLRQPNNRNFPTRQRFTDLKNDGALSDPQMAGEALIAWLLSDAMGEDPIADIREFS